MDALHGGTFRSRWLCLGRSDRCLLSIEGVAARVLAPLEGYQTGALVVTVLSRVDGPLPWGLCMVSQRGAGMAVVGSTHDRSGGVGPRLGALPATGGFVPLLAGLFLDMGAH